MSAAPDTDDGPLAAGLRAPAFGRRARAAHPSAEWPPFAPPVYLAAGPLGVAQAADREIARQTAIRARALAEFAATRPATVDRPQGVKGAMSPERWAARPDLLREVSEWATPEVAIALSRSDQAAENELHRSLQLLHRLPGTLAALEAGALHRDHQWPLLEHVAPVRDPRVRAEIEAECLRWAAGRVVTPGQLGDKARREVLRRDARDAAQNLTRAIRRRGVHLTPSRTAGMAELTALLTLPEAKALHASLAALADTAQDDPADPAGPRTRGQKMADALVDLVLRPGEADGPPVQLLLTLVAPLATAAGGDAPGELDGQPIPAEMVRALLAALTARGIDLTGSPDKPTATDSDLAADDPAADDPAPAADSDPAGAVDVFDQPPAEAAESQLEAAERTLYEREQEDLARWEEEFRGRILAGEFDDLPASGPISTDPQWTEAEQRAERRWQEEYERRVLAGDFDGPPELSDDPPDADSNPDPPEPAEQSAEGGWWAAADRAVDQASHAQRNALQALGHAQAMVRTAQRADAADDQSWRDRSGGRLTAAEDALAALAACSETQRAALADLLDATAGGGLADRPRLALTDSLTGALLALTDLPDLRRAVAGTGLGPPGPTDGYRPSAPLNRFLRARDRRCRQPGCRRRVPKGGELDHNRPYPDGPTAASNMTGFCDTHHRGKHQAPGWTYDLTPDGTLTVTTPSGITAVSTPPSY